MLTVVGMGISGFGGTIRKHIFRRDIFNVQKSIIDSPRDKTMSYVNMLSSLMDDRVNC